MSNQRQFHNVALIGFMGTGKSSVGRLLAMQMRFEFVDTDDILERRAGRKIAEIFAQDGEGRFRLMEQALVEEMGAWRHRVIATGGGLGANQANLNSLKQHSLVVCLWASADEIWRRVRRQSHRPLLQDPDPLGRIHSLLADRRPFYTQADVLIGSDHRSVREVTGLILHEFQVVQPRVLRSEKADTKARG